MPRNLQQNCTFMNSILGPKPCTLNFCWTMTWQWWQWNFPHVFCYLRCGVRDKNEGKNLTSSLRNPQDYAQRPQQNWPFMNSISGPKPGHTDFLLDNDMLMAKKLSPKSLCYLRCGVRDSAQDEYEEGDERRRRRRKRYMLEGSRWQKSTLTWRVDRYPARQRLTNQQAELPLNFE